LLKLRIYPSTDITKLSRTQLAKWRAANIGYIFQTHNLIPVLTAYENVEMPLLLLPMNRSERRKRIEIALGAVDLLDRADHYPRQMSGGQEQRAGIARAIVANPKVVVADEQESSSNRELQAYDQTHPLRFENALAASLSNNSYGQRFSRRAVCVLLCRKRPARHE
jgi:putative ABC transport system ATP-binding protein